jgi:outer membrane receptor for ferrienterochelin and colicins
MITLGLTEGSTTEFTYINIGNFKTTGGRLNANFGYYHFKADVGFAVVGRYNQISDSFDAPSFSFSPEFRAALTYDLKKSGTSFALFYNYVGNQPNYSVNDAEEVTLGEVADYHLLDVTASQKFWKDRIVWSVGAKNLLNVRQVQSNTGGGGVHSSGGSSIPVAWGTSVFTSLAIKFNTGLKKKKS